MPEVGLDRLFLHRCCVQMSSALADDAAVAAEVQHTLRFVRDHARSNPGEITRALVWRIVDTDNNEVEDRLGAWCVLNAVLTECADIKQPLSSTAVAEKIGLFLPYLISYRWHSVRDTSTGNNAAPFQSAVSLLSGYDKVVPASVLVGDESRMQDAAKEQEIRAKYSGFLTTWKGVWRHDIYQRLKETVRQAERGGNTLSSREQAYLDIPDTFRDSLRRLRRRDPRPSMAFHVLSCYGWVPPAESAAAAAGIEIVPGAIMNGTNEGQLSSNNDYAKRCPQGPRSIEEIDKLDPAAHPRVRQWLKKLVEASGGCRLCDVWQHTEARCPCELPFIKVPAPEDNSSLRLRRRRVERAGVTYLDAVETLFRYGIRLPLSVEKVLDRVVSLIVDEAPYEEFLEAFDTVRGAVTGPLERHALWLHASYMLMPSRTVFGKPNDDALSPSMEKAERYFKAKRHFREWDYLLQSVEVLDRQYRRAELSPGLRRSIEEVQSTKSFFFSLIDGSLSAEYIPQSYARAPEEVMQLRPVKDILCPVCIEPFHTAAHCTKGTEPWDLSVARILLEEHNLLSMKFPEERHMFDSALRSIDEDDRRAKEFRKKELSLAVKLVHENRVPYCKFCNIMGHSIRRCEENARRVFHRHNLKEVDVRLEPNTVQRKIRQLREAHDTHEARALSEAWELLGRGRTYPESFLSAIRELQDAQIPLAAARYSTDAVQGFLLFIKSSDLLQHLQPFRDDRFPDVCLFCDSYHHPSEACDRASAEECGFLAELRRCGLTLWNYLRSPARCDERFPTDFAAGRATVVRLARQFAQDYSPGGIARAQFLQANGLDGDATAAEVSEETGGRGRMSHGSSQRSFYGGSSYGMSFSQLILQPADNYDDGGDKNNNSYSNSNNINSNNNINNDDNNHHDHHHQDVAVVLEWGVNGEAPMTPAAATHMCAEPAESLRDVAAGGHGGKRGRDDDADALLLPSPSDGGGEEVGADEMMAAPHESHVVRRSRMESPRRESA